MQNNNLDDFMPKDVQQHYLKKGLKSIAKILGENKFEDVYKTVVILNKYLDGGIEI